MLVTERDITVARTHVGGHNSAQSHFQQDILCLSSLYVELGLLLQGGKKWVQNHVYWLETALITRNSLNQLCKNINHNLRVLKDNCNLHNWNILLLQLILEVPFTCSTGGWPPGNLCTVLLTTLGQCHAYSLMNRPTKWQSRNDWMLVFPLLQVWALTLSKPIPLPGQALTFSVDKDLTTVFWGCFIIIRKSFWNLWKEDCKIPQCISL